MVVVDGRDVRTSMRTALTARKTMGQLREEDLRKKNAGGGRRNYCNVTIYIRSIRTC
jgi:hypothetical protein